MSVTIPRNVERSINCTSAGNLLEETLPLVRTARTLDRPDELSDIGTREAETKSRSNATDSLAS